GGGGGSGLEAIYLDIVAKSVKQNWSYPAYGAQDDLLASVELTIAADGTIQSYRLTRSSGREAYDDSVLRAVASTAKVPPPTRDDLRVIVINFNPREP
ncbi:MAG: energy transducer TonB, partial [Desulfovibrionaceae bacterium]